LNIFEQASINKLRFSSAVGDITTEQLWDLPLTANGDRVDLDKLARLVNSELKSIDECSFVNLKPDPRKRDLELRLDILKHVIEAKLTAKAAKEKAIAESAYRRKLVDALASKEAAEISGMTKEQIQAELAKLAG
jgi:hypothetical protein